MQNQQSCTQEGKLPTFSKQMELIPKEKSAAVKFLQEIDEHATFLGGDDEKKVYKLCSKKNCVAVKIVSTEEKDANVLKDAKSQQTLTDIAKHSKQAEPHVSEMLAIVPLTSTSVALVSEYEGFVSVSDFLQNKSLSTRDWKSINLQFIKTLVLLQDLVPGFTHNDAHTDNVMLVSNTTHHTCKIKSANGRMLTDTPKWIVRVIDFDQMLANRKTLQTSEGTEFWKSLEGNKISDFVRFSVWSFEDLRIRRRSKGSYPVWFKQWLEFCERWIDPNFFAVRKNKWLQFSYKGPTKVAERWLKKFDSKSEFELSDLLDDPFFDEFTKK